MSGLVIIGKARVISGLRTDPFRPPTTILLITLYLINDGPFILTNGRHFDILVHEIHGLGIAKSTVRLAE